MLNHPYFLLIIAPLIWAGNTIAGKLATDAIAPMTLTLLRWIVAVLVLLPFVLPGLYRDWAAVRSKLLLLFACGCFGFAGFNMLYYKSLHYTTAINVALLQATIPILILLINWLIYRQRMGGAQLLGVVMAFVGVVLIITNGQVSALLTLSLNYGDLLMLAACLMYAAYSIGLRAKPSIRWGSFIFVLAISALLTVLPFAAYEIAIESQVFVFSFKSLLLVIYVSIFASIISQIAYAKGVSIVGANRAGFAINLVPVFGALMAVLLLGEQFRWYHLASLVLVLGGIALSERSAKQLSQQ